MATTKKEEKAITDAIDKANDHLQKYLDHYYHDEEFAYVNAVKFIVLTLYG